MKETKKGERYMDAPNARPSDEAYEDALSRYGTPEFTDTDAAMVSKWRQDHPDWDKELDDDSDREGLESDFQLRDHDDPDSDPNNDDPSSSEDEEDATSRGSSSRPSSAKTVKKGFKK